jgi:hypothetical protein
VTGVQTCALPISELDSKGLQSLQEWSEINWQFWMKSTHQIIAGCVGALDGFFPVHN